MRSLFHQFEPNVKAVIAYLKLLRVSVNHTTVNETMQNHPDWPSLLCVSDSLYKWNIPNAAYKTEPDLIDQLPIPFIAYTHDRENPISIVIQVTEDAIKVLSKNYHNAIIESKEAFLKKWTGVYLIAEPLEESGESGYEKNKAKAVLQSFIPVSFLFLLFGFSFFSINKTMQGFVDDSSVSVIGVYLQSLILIGGVLTTSFLLWYEIDKTNPLLQKVCTGIAKGNCNAILTGKQSKLFSWLSWSEVGFFYFAGGLLMLVLGIVPINNAISIIAWLNLLALTYTVFSIYYQWRVAKQWCVLCLSVQALLVLGVINVVTNKLVMPLNDLSAPLVLKTILLYLIPVLLWFSLKPFILRLQEAKNTKREYLRIKFNTEIFLALLKKQKSVTVSTEGLGIDLGNPAANNTLIKVCNPYCGPCAKAHPKMEKLITANANIKAKIIFTTPNNIELQSYKPSVHLLAIAEQKNDTKIKKALDDWYLAEKKDYETFAVKYPINTELIKQGNKIDTMDKWCKDMDIRATPTFFINGYQIPDAYNIEDLTYFLAE
ncbi:MAG: thioredoxin domain-containing protein [Sediminibacterium sp.]|nr:thioredoxin domain-containing protein [Sediminibacterium sp.]